jgi:2-hydroxyglutarate dehydrogenase
MRMCLRGKHLLYERCRNRGIPHKRVGKLIVGRAEHKGYLEHLVSECRNLHWPKISRPIDDSEPRGAAVPAELISGDEARQLEPNISPDIEYALWSPSTGIVDSHSLLTSLEQDIQESGSGQLVYATEVVRVDPLRPGYLPSSNTSSQRPREDGWVVQVSTGGSKDALLARTLINAAGLSSTLILNSLIPNPIPMFYARGSYASYNGKALKSSRLIYPVPALHGNSHSFHSLGTHLTVDLAGKIRFGPDLEFLNPPEVGQEESESDHADFWQKWLRPDEARLAQMHEAVSLYLTGVELQDLNPDYVGIRPKLVGPGAGFCDFTMRTEFSGTSQKAGKTTGAPMINLLGIESPGLTGCLALGEYVANEMMKSLGCS